MAIELKDLKIRFCSKNRDADGGECRTKVDPHHDASITSACLISAGASDTLGAEGEKCPQGDLTQCSEHSLDCQKNRRADILCQRCGTVGGTLPFVRFSFFLEPSSKCFVKRRE